MEVTKGFPMISKLTAVALLAGAFGYALWLHILRRPLPDVPNMIGRRGWRRKFFWATALFAAWFGMNAGGCGGGSDLDIRPRPGSDRNPMMTCYSSALPPPSGPDEGSAVMCYVPVVFISTPVAETGLSAAVRAAWLSLDGNRGEELRRALEREVAARGLGAHTARLLQIAFRETAYHYYRTRSKDAAWIDCYYAGPGVVGETREFLLTRMEFLAEAGRKGQIDKETYEKVAADIARSLAALDEMRARQTLHGTMPASAGAADMEAARVLADMAANAPEGWADSSKPGVWQPPPPPARPER